MKKRITRKLAHIGLAVALGASLMAAPTAFARGHYKAAATQNMTRTDVYGVSQEVRHRLLMLPYYGVFDWLQYQVQPDGTVTLDGAVTRPTTKSSAEKTVSRIEGVTNVDNNIDVLPPSPTDDRLRIALYRNIYSGPLFHYATGSLNTIHIIVDHGRVTLEGTVSSSGDKTIAYTRANEVPGIFSVTNNLRVTRDEDRM